MTQTVKHYVIMFAGSVGIMQKYRLNVIGQKTDITNREEQPEN